MIKNWTTRIKKKDDALFIIECLDERISAEMLGIGKRLKPFVKRSFAMPVLDYFGYDVPVTAPQR